MLKSGGKAEPQLPSPANHVVSSSLLLSFSTAIEQDPQNLFTLQLIYQHSCRGGIGKLGEYSDKFGSIIGNQAEYSDKSANAMADAASRAEASLQLMEIGIASYTMKNTVLPEISLAVEICPNFHPIYVI
jgi:hypothetical protein